jgi:hypothetical protein
LQACAKAGDIGRIHWQVHRVLAALKAGLLTVATALVQRYSNILLLRFKPPVLVGVTNEVRVVSFEQCKT